ncbi:hypothetical protein bthur0001_20790 [Bacillus thuringiensis serovar tochigiensis BGSC 4Y1]|nr:hypothetical protein bcere0010_20650 [Bacillus cereus ATCC 4342]EEM22743.1 hypothetical protein bthur0001_20790 [Bacillus thuringiensis serovar tochigiensis BGSC 4Y1]
MEFPSGMTKEVWNRQRKCFFTKRSYKEYTVYIKMFYFKI